MWCPLLSFISVRPTHTIPCFCLFVCTIECLNFVILSNPRVFWSCDELKIVTPKTLHRAARL